MIKEERREEERVLPHQKSLFPKTHKLTHLLILWRLTMDGKSQWENNKFVHKWKELNYLDFFFFLLPPHYSWYILMLLVSHILIVLICLYYKGKTVHSAKKEVSKIKMEVSIVPAPFSLVCYFSPLRLLSP